jgi:hypothetical protein
MYMTYNFFFALFTVLPILIWLAVSVLVAIDADKLHDEAWTLAGESKNVWLAISILLVWPFGLFFYLFLVRRKIAGIAHSINEDTLITKAANRIRKENAKTDHSKGSTVVTPATEHKASHSPVASDEGVFDYEESENDVDSNNRVANIPPKPDYAPTIQNVAVSDEKDSESFPKTDVYPHIPAKPDHEPSIHKVEDK